MSMSTGKKDILRFIYDGEFREVYDTIRYDNILLTFCAQNIENIKMNTAKLRYSFN